MSARSRSARGMILTRYAMRGFELGEEFLRVPSLPCFRLLQPLPDAFAGISARRNVKQALIGFGILHDGGSLALDGEHDGAFAFLELFYEIARPAPKGG